LMVPVKHWLLSIFVDGVSICNTTAIHAPADFKTWGFI